MTSALETWAWAQEYRVSLEKFLGGEGETALLEAYRLGRRAIHLKLGVIQITTMHHEAVAAILRVKSSLDEIVETTTMAAVVEAETLSAFEMALRGYQEANTALIRVNAELDQQATELRDARDELELRVKERTLALVQANQKLQAEVVERTRTEELLRASLRERETLLKELHHRVKNNLAVIDGLLTLQGSRFKDPAVLDALRDSRNRIRSMAAVHESLYRSRELSRIDFAAYAERLCRNLLAAYATDPEQVALELALEPIEVDLDLAIPLGLLLNELVCNALKHAFPAGRPGRIVVDLQKETEGPFVLAVRDDGIGLTPRTEGEQPESLGLELINIMVDQIDATFAVKQDHGTTFTIRFTPRPSRRSLPRSPG